MGVVLAQLPKHFQRMESLIAVWCNGQGMLRELCLLFWMLFAVHLLTFWSHLVDCCIYLLISLLDNVIVMSIKCEVPVQYIINYFLYAWETFGSAMGIFEFARDVKISIPDPNVSLYRISTSFVYHLIDLHILWVSNLCGKTIWIG